MAAVPSSKRAVSQALQSVQQLLPSFFAWWVQSAWLWPGCAAVAAASAWPVLDPKASVNGPQGNTSSARLSVTTVASRRRRKHFRFSRKQRIIVCRGTGRTKLGRLRAAVRSSQSFSVTITKNCHVGGGSEKRSAHSELRPGRTVFLEEVEQISWGHMPILICVNEGCDAKIKVSFLVQGSDRSYPTRK